MSARLLDCCVVRVPSQWKAQGLPPPDTHWVPLALLERFSYANEAAPVRHLPPSNFPSLPFPSSKTAPDLSLCFDFSELERPVSSEAEQLGKTSLCSMCYGHRDQTSWLGSLSPRHMGKETVSSPLLHRWLH